MKNNILLFALVLFLAACNPYRTLVYDDTKDAVVSKTNGRIYTGDKGGLLAGMATINRCNSCSETLGPSTVAVVTVGKADKNIVYAQNLTGKGRWNRVGETFPLFYGDTPNRIIKLLRPDDRVLVFHFGDTSTVRRELWTWEINYPQNRYQWFWSQ